MGGRTVFCSSLAAALLAASPRDRSLLTGDDDDSASNPQRNEFEHEYLARKFGGAGSDSAASELDIATWKFVEFLHTHNMPTHQETKHGAGRRDKTREHRKSPD